MSEITMLSQISLHHKEVIVLKFRTWYLISDFDVYIFVRSRRQFENIVVVFLTSRNTQPIWIKLGSTELGVKVCLLYIFPVKFEGQGHMAVCKKIAVFLPQKILLISVTT